MNDQYTMEAVIDAIKKENPLKLQQVLLHLSKNTSLNQGDNHGLTPLHFACQLSCDRCALILLEAGANPNVKALGGLTPLYVAKKIGTKNMIALLERYSAKIQ